MSATGIKLAIVGSVRFTHPGDWERSQQVIRRSIHRLRPKQVISGGAEGIDTIAAAIAAGEFGYSEDDGTLRVFRPKVQRWDGEGGFKERNLWIAVACTHLLRVYCSSSRTYGSGWTADQAEHLGKSVRRYYPCVVAEVPA